MNHLPLSKLPCRTSPRRGVRQYARGARRSARPVAARRVAAARGSVRSGAPRFSGARRLRSATTMTEVLVSLLVMSIGVVSLATLFPLSVLRSVQATQLTNATVLRQNAEAQFDLYPTNQSNLFAALNNSLTPQVNPFAGVPVPSAGASAIYVIDPRGYWPPLPTPANNFPPAPANTATLLGAQPGFVVSQFGNNNANNGGGAAAYAIGNATGNVQRWCPTALQTFKNHPSQAMLAVLLPDSWITMYEGIPQSVDASGLFLTLNPGDVPTKVSPADLSNTLAAATPMRVVVYDNQSRESVVRPVTGVSTTSPFTVSWATPLPPNGRYSQAVAPIPQVRIEHQDIRYTWLSTLRCSLSSDGVQRTFDHWYIVVFFKRDLSFDQNLGGYDDEYVYNNGGGLVFTAGLRTAQITYAGPIKPSIKRGSYVFDPQNGIWYRIQTFNIAGSPNSNEIPSAGTVNLQLDQFATHNSSQAVFLHNVVEVYEIAPRTIAP